VIYGEKQFEHCIDEWILETTAIWPLLLILDYMALLSGDITLAEKNYWNFDQLLKHKRWTGKRGLATANTQNISFLHIIVIIFYFYQLVWYQVMFHFPSDKLQQVL